MSVWVYKRVLELNVTNINKGGLRGRVRIYKGGLGYISLDL